MKDTMKDYLFLSLERSIFRSHRREAVHAVNQRRWKEAVKGLEHIQFRMGGRLGVGSSIRLARAYEEVGRTHHARRVLRHALSSFPNDERLYQAIIELESRVGDWDAVLRYWSRRAPGGIQLKPDAYVEVVRRLRSAGRSEEAIRTMAEALAAYPGNLDLIAAFHEPITAKRHVYIIVRYSILTATNGYRWRVGKDVEFEAYRRNLFDRARLDARLHLFRHVTLASLAAQDFPEPDAMTLIVLTSRDLPPDARAALDDAVSPYPWAQVHGLSPTENVLDQLRVIMEADVRERAGNERLAYASVWLDDDDGLARHYLQELWSYIDPSMTGYCVTFAKGHVGSWDAAAGELSHLHVCHAPNISTGLAAINTFTPGDGFGREWCTVYHIRSMGHQYIDRSAPTIRDTRRAMYFCTLHKTSDTGRNRNARRLRQFLHDLEAVPETWEAVAADVELDMEGLKRMEGQHLSIATGHASGATMAREGAIGATA